MFEDETAEELMRDADQEVEEEDEDGEELIGDQMQEDYRAIPELDTYDAAMLADEAEVVDELDAEGRQGAEQAMKKRDAATARGRTQGRGRDILDRFADEDEDDAADGDGTDLLQRRTRRKAERAANGEGDAADPYMEMGEDDEYIANLEDRKGASLREWVLTDLPRKEIHRRFKKFLKSFVDENGDNVHAGKIKAMCEANGESLVISYTHLCQEYPVLAIFVADAPTEVLEIFDKAAVAVVRQSFPAYHMIRPDIHVRIAGLPVSDNIRDIRQMHLNQLVKVSGVVNRRSGIFPQLKLAMYSCAKCDASIGPYVQDTIEPSQVTNCPECQSKGPFSLKSESTVYRNYQRVSIQESPGSVPAGRLPRSKDVILLADLVDSIKPGDQINLTGIYRNNFDQGLNARQGFPVFKTAIEANYIEKAVDKVSKEGLTDEEITAIRELAKQDNIGERIFASIAPSIYGHEDIKIALALALFGGEPKNMENKSRIRGDINVLMLGDPGTAKSQFLKYISQVSPRSVFTTGQGASAVGLTAHVARDPETREWTLNGGALVLADQGVCMIDEFDKMNDQDRTSIHEAMEQQTISISKAGIVTSLQARCAVIAAANPVRGRYQPGLTFSENVDLTEPIISRFDVLCVVKDTIDPVTDEKLARFVTGNHLRGHPSEKDKSTLDDRNPLVISQDLLRKYIAYAKQNVHPKLHNMDQDKIANLYKELRKESAVTGSIPITVRQVDGIIRLSEAHAKLHLRDYVREDDVNMAIRIIVTSFVSTQKFSISKQMARVFSKYMSYKKDNNDLLYHVLAQITREELKLKEIDGEDDDRITIDVERFTEKAKELEVHDLATFYKSDQFLGQGYTFDAGANEIVKVV
jgi:DNA replication licensing factor MCM2